MVTKMARRFQLQLPTAAFMAAAVACIALMWLVHAFLFPGRMILTAAYCLLLVFTLVTALNTQSDRAQIQRQQQSNFFAQVAAALGIREGSAKVLYFRAKEKLAAQLKEQLAGPEEQENDHG